MTRPAARCHTAGLASRRRDRRPSPSAVTVGRHRRPSPSAVVHQRHLPAASGPRRHTWLSWLCISELSVAGRSPSDSEVGLVVMA